MIRIRRLLRLEDSGISDAELGERYLQLMRSYILVMTNSEDKDIRELAEQKLQLLTDAADRKSEFEVSVAKGCPEDISHYAGRESTYASVRTALNGSQGIDQPALLKSLNNCGGDAQAWYLKAQLHMRSRESAEKRFKEAIEALDRACSLDESNMAYALYRKAIKDAYETLQNNKLAEARRQQELAEARMKGLGTQGAAPNANRTNWSEFASSGLGAGLISVCVLCGGCGLLGNCCSNR